MRWTTCCSAIWVREADARREALVRDDAMHAKVDGEIKYLLDAPPAPGETLPLLDGLTWVRVPLPFVLDHVNCWLLDDGAASDGVTLIDTGADRPETRALWTHVLSAHLGERRVSRLVCTHGHPDHVGLAGWLCETLNVPLHMTLAEWLAPQVWREESLKPMTPATKAFFSSHGVSGQEIAGMDRSRESAPFSMSPMPSSFVRMRDGDTIKFGGRSWKVLVNGGHADEHASFYCKEDGLMIAGDQILSRISPVVGVFPAQPQSEPLSDYLASLKRLRKLPADTIVLPSHGMPFRGLHARIDQLSAHHAARLGTLWELLSTPSTGIEMALGLFPKAMAAKGQTVMALAETLAHAQHLVAKKQATRNVAADGTVRFARK